jgi:small nuclear ribonucleoprotein
LVYQTQKTDTRSERLRVDPPPKYIRNALNTEVLVRLKDGSEFVGKLVDYDSVMNLILEDSKEVDRDGNPRINLGKVMIRGSQIIFVRVAPQP